MQFKVMNYVKETTYIYYLLKLFIIIIIELLCDMIIF